MSRSWTPPTGQLADRMSAEMGTRSAKVKRWDYRMKNTRQDTTNMGKEGRIRATIAPMGEAESRLARFLDGLGREE